MQTSLSRLATYDPNNLRFRKASIRDRLAEIKAERESLIEERDAIDKRLQSAPSETEQLRNGAGLSIPA